MRMPDRDHPAKIRRSDVFRALPPERRWRYFVDRMLPGLTAFVLVAALLAASLIRMVWFPAPKLSVVVMGSWQTTALQDMSRRMAERNGLKEREVSITTVNDTDDGYSQLEQRIAKGDVDFVAVPQRRLESLAERGLLGRLFPQLLTDGTSADAVDGGADGAVDADTGTVADAYADVAFSALVYLPIAGTNGEAPDTTGGNWHCERSYAGDAVTCSSPGQGNETYSPASIVAVPDKAGCDADGDCTWDQTGPIMLHQTKPYGLSLSFSETWNRLFADDGRDDPVLAMVRADDMNRTQVSAEMSDFIQYLRFTKQGV